MARSEKIVISGARAHNLKGIDLELPRDALIVITGLSGSGKSSLAFDTLYAEGQRRYVESLSSYARQFLGLMEKPDVDSIEGLSPAISIDQKTTSRNPRSTVGTVTEIYDYLRLLWARIGKPHCYNCGQPIQGQSLEQITDRVLSMEDGKRFMVMAPVVRGRKGEYGRMLAEMRSQGYARAMIDGELRRLDEEIELDKKYKHDISIVVDRLVMKEGIRKRLSESIEAAAQLADGLIAIQDPETGEEQVYSERFACLNCGASMPEIEPRIFSFNSPHGACERCHGLGFQRVIDPELIVPDPTLSIAEGALDPWTKAASMYHRRLLEAVAESSGIDTSTPWRELDQSERDLLLDGTGSEKHTISYKNRFGRRRTYNVRFPGHARLAREALREHGLREHARPGRGAHGDAAVPGVRRRAPAARVARRHGRRPRHLGVHPPVGEGGARVGLAARAERDRAGDRPADPARGRGAPPLPGVGRHRLPLARARRVHALRRRGAADPPRDADRLEPRRRHVHPRRAVDRPPPARQREADRHARAPARHRQHRDGRRARRGHDERGRPPGRPRARRGRARRRGRRRGHARAGQEGLALADGAVPGRQALDRRARGAPQADRRAASVKNAREHNLKGIDASFPLGTFTCVTGVSGSGKSTLVNEILYRSAANRLHRARQRPGAHDGVEGIDQIDKIINIDQSPIGRTPRSNPATYTGLFDVIRDIYSKTKEARARGYKPGRFSFNVKGGRCEVCRGDGQIKIEMHFLPDVYVPCEQCHGRRYNRETLEVRFKGKSIADVLDMPVGEALEFFDAIPKLKRRLQTLHDVGLDYIRLGQPATTLSGGEAQRVKLATELSKIATGRTLYILDEPTTGLHFADVERLLEVLSRLVDQGNTVLVIEHNLDVIKSADRIVDLGPEGGDAGGEIIATGTPEQVAGVPGSHTGRFLARAGGAGGADGPQGLALPQARGRRGLAEAAASRTSVDDDLVDRARRRRAVLDLVEVVELAGRRAFFAEAEAGCLELRRRDRDVGEAGRALVRSVLGLARRRRTS